MLIRDRVALGTITGIVGTVPQLLINFVSFRLGLAKYYSFQIAAGVHVAKHLVDTLTSFILGGVIWELTGAVLGIITVYFIRTTGKSYWWLKGILVPNLIMYTIVYGFLWDMGGSKVIPLDLESTATELLGNTIFGLTTSYLITRWGEGLPNEPIS